MISRKHLESVLDLGLLPLINGYRTIRPLKKNNQILLFASPRGGSTWMANILNAIPRSCVFSEPFTKDRLKPFADINFAWNQHIPDNENWEEALLAFDSLFKHRCLTSKIFTKQTFQDYLFAKEYIYKIVNGHLFLPWLASNTKHKIVFLIRHPASVVLSQLKSPGWESAKKNPSYTIEPQRYSEFYNPYREILGKVNSTEAHLTAKWALMNHSIIDHPLNNKRWHTLTYENLLLHPQKELERLFDYLEMDIPKSIMSSHSKASATTTKKDINNNQLTNWKKELSDFQQKEIFGVLKDFNINYYSNHEYPDLELIQP